MVTIAAFMFTGTILIVIAFYVGLVLGAPWGAAAMGGRFPRKFPFWMRGVSLINIGLLFFINLIVLSRANIFMDYLYKFSTIAIWFVVAFFLLGTLLNAITPSKVERVWAPIAFILFMTSLFIALS